jgi:drug/metabolite transporter (DMT)-like permease
MTATSPAPRGAALAYAMLVVVMACWAGNSIVGRAVRDSIPPFALALVRWAGALAVLAPFALRHILAERRRILSAWRPILLLGVLGVACFNAFLYSGLRHTTATNALLLQAAIPALVLAFNFALFRQQPRGLEVAGVAISTAGVVLIVSRGDFGALARTGLNRGDLLVMAGMLCWAAYTSLLRRRPAVHPLAFLFATFVIGAVAMAPFAALEWASGERIVWSPLTIGSFAYVAVLPSVVAYALFNAAVARLGPGPAGQAINLMPVFGAFLAAAMLGEALRGYHFAGIALVVAGIAAPALGVFRKGPSPAAHQAPARGAPPRE